MRLDNKKMKLKRILSLLLTFLMLVSSVAIPVFADDEANTQSITVYVNVSECGRLMKSQDQTLMALVSLELSGKASYTLDDAFSLLHDNFYTGGSDAGYDTDEGDYGLYITKFWGNTEGRYGYQVNAGSEYVSGLSHGLEDGDVIDVAIYENTYPDTESYSYFDAYRKTAYMGKEFELTLNRTGYDESWSTVISACGGASITVDGAETSYVTDENGKVKLKFDETGEYIISAEKEKSLNSKQVADITAPVCVVKVSELPDTCITVPDDAELFVGKKPQKYFMKSEELEPVYSEADGDNIKYYYELEALKNEYNYRVSGGEYITYGGLFKKVSGTPYSLAIGDERLKPDGKARTTVDRDTASNNGKNVADIYLNINSEGCLRLSSGQKKQIVALRNWEAVNTTSKNYFIEPDFHFAVTDENGNASDVVEIDKSGVLTAKKSGTAIVCVTYDAMTLNFGAGDDFYGAVYPENTGVFVVTVDETDSGIQSGITLNSGKNTADMKLAADMLDSELDCIYFTGESGSYTFTPITEGVKVYVANPTVAEKISYSGFKEISSDEGTYTIPLTEGRNIVKLEKDGKSNYQLITTKKVNVIVNSGDAVAPGDSLTVVFDKLYHPANKLAGIYNTFANAVYTDVSGYDGQLIGAADTQYDFANKEASQSVNSILNEIDYYGLPRLGKDETAELKIPDDYPYDTFTLSGGMFYVAGWGRASGGSAFGVHREIDYETGVGTGIAPVITAYLGRLPDIEIPITVTQAEFSSISLDTENVKTSYYAGDKFDTEGLAVTAHYADGKTQLVRNYTVSPKILTADTDKVTVTYKGSSQEIPVSVVNPKISGLKITAPPSKLNYTAGEAFNPSGMIVYAVYENGAEKETSDYTYSPNRELEAADTEMTITYNGENAVVGIKSVKQPITVTEASSGGGSSSSDTITVYFTLLGDKKHGNPSGASDTHTKKKGNLETWISRTKITLKKGSYVIDAVEKALSINGIPYTNTGNYISKIKGLSETDNGGLSGWMYTLNGRYTDLGVEQQGLNGGDAIVFHYTDDYTAENTGYSSSSSGGSSGGSSSKNDTAKTDDSENKNENKNENGNENIKTDEKLTLSENTFSDVKPTDWYFEAVGFAYENKLMQGTGESFEPDESMLRAMLVTVLWRLENEPSAVQETTFTDAVHGEWYFEAVSWAESENIISGVGGGLFGIDEEITREQLAAILYRYAQKKQIAASTDDDVLSGFSDSSEISDYALDAVKWAVSVGILQGDGDRLFPLGTATRAEAAAMLMRFCKLI